MAAGPALSDLLDSLNEASPPNGIPELVRALWFEANGNWDRAHEIAQDDDSADGSWVHAYLHRVEGDLGNAGYWYRRAGKSMPEGDLKSEWQSIAEALLEAA